MCVWFDTLSTTMTMTTTATTSEVNKKGSWQFHKSRGGKWTSEKHEAHHKTIKAQNAQNSLRKQKLWLDPHLFVKVTQFLAYWRCCFCASNGWKVFNISEIPFDFLSHLGIDNCSERIILDRFIAITWRNDNFFCFTLMYNCVSYNPSKQDQFKFYRFAQQKNGQ